VDRFLVGVTLKEDSTKITYDGWAGKANAGASEGTYRQGKSKTLGATCGTFRRPQIDPITAKDPTCGTARVQDLSTETWVRDFQVDLSSRRVEWQYFVSVIELDPNKTYRLEVTSDDDAPIVFDGCAGTVVGRLN
jgi:hypothetical protein